MQKLNWGMRGGWKRCALGCPGRSSVFADKAASSYAGRALNVLLFPLGGYLCLLGFHHSGSTGHVQVSCAIQVCVLLIDRGRNVCSS